MSTIEEAKEVIEQFIEQGVDDVIENSDNFIENLKIASGIKQVKIATKKTGNSNPARGSLASINQILSGSGYSIKRDDKTWPLYHVYKGTEIEYSLLFKGKVSELHDILSTQGLDGVTQYKQS